MMYSNQDDARAAPRGDIKLAYCPECGLIHNLAFQSSLVDYAPGYENSLHSSPRFQAYAEALASSLIDRHRLHGRVVVEYGCGRGDFLRLFAKDETNKLFGFDPSAGRPMEVSGGVTIFRDRSSVCEQDLNADLIVLRHVLEHVAEPRSFLTELRRVFGDRSHRAIYIEVPNSEQILHSFSVWDIIYDHYTYFTKHSLAGLLARSGFAAAWSGTGFAGQFLAMEGQPIQTGPEEPRQDSGPRSGDSRSLELGDNDLGNCIGRFSQEARRRIEYWESRLSGWCSAGDRVALWGAGAKGVMFLNTVDRNRRIHAVVDINPAKRGRFLAGTGHVVLAPAELVASAPDVILLMNDVYRPEIEEQLGDIGLRTRILSTTCC